jgi:hypothetical protein
VENGTKMHSNQGARSNQEFTCIEVTRDGLMAVTHIEVTGYWTPEGWSVLCATHSHL